MNDNTGYDEPNRTLPEPSPVRQSPFTPGTDQTILNWLNKLNAVISDLQKAQKAGLNVMALLMRAQTAFSTFQRIYQTYYGQIPQS